MRIAVIILQLILQMFFVLSSETTFAAGNSTAQAPSIVIVGDSLSAAYGMKLDESWPSLLQARLQRDGYSHRVFNSSIAGDTTQGGRSRLPRLLDKHGPDVVIIELGANDGLRGLPLDVTKANLEAMIRASQDMGAEVLLTEMRIPPNYGATYTEGFRANYSILEEAYGIELVPFILEDIVLDEEMMQPDGIHPNSNAQPVLLEKYWNALHPLLGDAVGG